MTEPSRLRPARPGEVTPEQEQARMRFQQQHPEVGFRRLAYPFPHWMAYWMAGSEVQGRANTDFGVLLGEVSEVFGWEDRGEEKGAAGR